MQGDLQTYLAASDPATVGKRLQIEKREQRKAPGVDLSKLQRGVIKRVRSKWGKKALLDLANLDTGDCRLFRRKFSVFLPPGSLGQDDDHLFAWRDELRQVWSLGPETGRILDQWVKKDPHDTKRWWVPLWLVDKDFIEPNPAHLPFLLALTVRDLVGRLGQCPNPECPHPYFIKDRKNQRFCDRPACATYGRREHKRKWWREKGPKWRANQQARKSVRKKKGRIPERR